MAQAVNLHQGVDPESGQVVHPRAQHLACPMVTVDFVDHAAHDALDDGARHDRACRRTKSLSKRKEQFERKQARAEADPQKRAFRRFASGTAVEQSVRNEEHQQIVSQAEIRRAAREVREQELFELQQLELLQAEADAAVAVVAAQEEEKALAKVHVGAAPFRAADDDLNCWVLV
uniref:Uncharacterized protein n=1 Tax=Noctiluca scintillans TaxID=2966 RepID=A0A7S1F423_NOCSC